MAKRNSRVDTSTADRGVSPDRTTTGQEKPYLSYIALISMAILSAPDQRMLLSEIYSWIASKFPYYRQRDKSWRNSIRHNLSLNECFIKAGRCETGKGNYWTIHPANTADFGQGDFRRRRARRRVRQCDVEIERIKCGLLETRNSSPPNKVEGAQNFSGDCYVPMTSTWLSPSVLASIFGREVVSPYAAKHSCKEKLRLCKVNVDPLSFQKFETDSKAGNGGENRSNCQANSSPLGLHSGIIDKSCCYFQEIFHHVQV